MVINLCTINIPKVSAQGTVPHSFQNRPTCLSFHVDGLGISSFGVSYNNLPKWIFGKGNGFKIIWVHVSRLPVPHPDRDKWKHTMFTNSTHIFQYASRDNSHRYVQIIVLLIIMIIIIHSENVKLCLRS